MISSPIRRLAMAVVACAAAALLPHAGDGSTVWTSPGGDGARTWHAGAVVAKMRRGGRPHGGGADNKGSDEETPATGPTNPRASRDVQERAGLIPTGLEPVFPKDADCLAVASPFASQTRYDGSPRVFDAFSGYHSGMDISTPIGTPLVAVADGEVVFKYEGGRMVGNRIILRHAPKDTGLNVWVYSLYQHFESMPKFNVGDRVKKGQYLGPAGNTGTTGGHYGVAGYAHLHMTVYVSDFPDYAKSPRSVLPKDVRFLDPVALYLRRNPPLTDNHAIAALPGTEKRVAISYVTTTGKVVPEGARFVWPVPCKPK